jgi:putative ABC transport system permease protein
VGTAPGTTLSDHEATNGLHGLDKQATFPGVPAPRPRAPRRYLQLWLAIAGAVPTASATAQRIDSIAPWTVAERAIAIDERLAADAGLRVGDRVVLSPEPGGVPGDTVRIAAIVRQRADPSEVARSDYRIRAHLDHLQRLIGYGDRVDRFAISTAGGAATDSVLRRINTVAFGFRAYRSREIAVETSKTFLVVSRFHRAIGMITIVASATFLLCIMLLKVDERRRDVAAMRLMGISRGTVVRTVMLESSFVALLGSVFGIGLGFATATFVNAHYQIVYRTPLKFAIITPSTVAYSVLLSLILGIGAGALAARRLARTPPLTLFGR